MLHRMNEVNFNLGGPVTQQSATSVAADVIRAAIVDGRLEPGQALREGTLARELGLSRTPIREALLLLHADGLIELAPNRGARVATYARADLQDAYGLRAVIESYAAGRAAERITSDQVAALEHSCAQFDALRAEADVVALVKENLAFHAIVHQASGSRRVPAVIRGLIQLPLLYRAHAWYSPDRKLISEYHHREITKALAERDAPLAEALMREHVVEAGQVALEAMDDD